MAVRVSSLDELRELCGRNPKAIDGPLPKGAGRNQSSAHTQLVKSCHEWLLLKGVFCWRNNTGVAMYGTRQVRYGVPGLPDILGALPAKHASAGLLFGVECKTGRGTLRDTQRTMEQEFGKTRALYIVARRIEDLEKWF